MPQTLRILLLIFLFTQPAISFSQEVTDFYINSKGNDNNPGNTVPLAKKTLKSLEPLLLSNYLAKGSPLKLAVKSGELFDENLLPPCPVYLTTYAENSKTNELAILNGTKEFSSGWMLEAGSNNVWKQSIPLTGFIGYGINGIGSYSYINVFEIDKALERTAPFTARKLLAFERDLATVKSTPGSFYIPVNTTDNPKPVYIHTSDEASPNAHAKYRYEVTVRDWAVNSTYQPNNKFENLWVRGFGAGNGMIPSGSNSWYNRMIFGPGAGIHHLVVRSGSINHALFLPGPKNTSAFAVVFYDNEGLGRHCAIKNSMFFDIPEPVYAHISDGTYYGAVEIDHVAAFTDPATANGFMFTFDTDSVLLNEVYTDGYKAGYYYGNAKYVNISNSWFKDVSFGIGYSPKFRVTANVKNVFIKTTGVEFTTGIYMQRNTTLTLSNSIMHLINSNNIFNGARAGSFVFGSGADTGITKATGNIFICDIDPSKSLTAATINTDRGIATSKDSWDNNVYILLRGKSIIWTATNPATNGGSENIQSFEEWKRQSGQDQHSLYFDLRKDPRGLMAIFADPEKGNYDLANTAEGNRIAALHAGMTDPITCFLQRPSYEQAAEMIKNNQVLSVKNCRNPCSQNKIRISASFDTTVINQRQIKLKWIVSEQQNIDHYELQRSMENPHFETIYTIPVTADSMYSFTDAIQTGIEYRYRLRIKPTGTGECYSSTLPVKTFDDKPFTIYPNPSTGKILISMNGYKGPSKLVVCNSLGQAILVKESYSWYLPIQLDCSGFGKGVYLLQVETTEGKTAKQFLLR